jgi:hypothetical protein
MNRQAMERHLAKAEEHIATGQRNIARQHKIIAELERDGHGTSTARKILQTFEELQHLQRQERDRAARELQDLVGRQSA